MDVREEVLEERIVFLADSQRRRERIADHMSVRVEERVPSGMTGAIPRLRQTSTYERRSVERVSPHFCGRPSGSKTFENTRKKPSL